LYLHIYKYVCIYMYVYIYTYVYTYIYSSYIFVAYVYSIYKYMHICIYTYMYVYVYIKYIFDKPALGEALGPRGGRCTEMSVSICMCVYV